MILPSHEIRPSAIPGAGSGVVLTQALARGRIAIAPDRIDQTWSLAQILDDPERTAQMHACARWFEDRYTLSPDWPDECYVNHSCAPTGLWLLGFVFAARDLAPGEELTVDYRHLLAPGQEEAFRDAHSGKPIVGYSWADSLRLGLDAVQRVLVAAPPAAGRTHP